MQRCACALARQGTTTAFTVHAATLTCSTRSFVQGAPPPPKQDMDPRRKEFLRSTQKAGAETETQHQARQRKIHEYFATHEPNCPEPLEENAFVKGKFGMRRRYFVDHRGKLDAFDLNDAIAESTNAMRK